MDSLVYSTTKSTKSAKESENKTVDAIFQPAVVQSVNLNVAASHVIGMVVEFYLRALRLLRGDFPPISLDERFA